MIKNIEKYKKSHSKPTSKGKGLLFCRFGGLNIVRQKNNYGKKGFHNAPERYGFYAFPFPYVEMFLAASTKMNEIKSGVYKKFKASEGYIWSHLEPRNKSDIIEVNNDWFKTTIEVYKKSLKICYANDAGCNQFQYGMPNRKNPYSFVSKDHLEVFITRETILKDGL
jgi:hypothetical protein